MPPVWGGSSMTKGGLFLSMLCLSALNTMSGLLPSSPPVIQLQEGGAGGGDPANRGSPHWPNLPHCLAPCPSPQADQSWAGWGLSVPKAWAAGGVSCWMRTMAEAIPDSQGTTRHPPEAFAKSACPGPRRGKDVSLSRKSPASSHTPESYLLSPQTPAHKVLEFRESQSSWS